jgi:hypothetical protein
MWWSYPNQTHTRCLLRVLLLSFTQLGSRYTDRKLKPRSQVSNITVLESARNFYTHSAGFFGNPEASLILFPDTIVFPRRSV